MGRSSSNLKPQASTSYYLCGWKPQAATVLMFIYLKPTGLINSDHPAIIQTANRLTEKCSGQLEQACALFAFVRDHITYDFAPEFNSLEDWRASETLERRSGMCQQKAVLLAALARACGIPSRVCFQMLRDYKLTPRFVKLIGDNVLPWHGLNALWLGRRWLHVDASLDQGLVERKRYRLVEFNGEADAHLHATDLAGKPHFEVVEDCGCFADFPREVGETILSLTWFMGSDWKTLVRREGASM